MLKLVTSVEMHLGLQIGHQKELCECLFCFFPFFFFFGKVVHMCVCLFFSIQKNELKIFGFHIGDGSSINKWNNLQAQILQKMLSCAHWLWGVNGSSQLGFGVNPPLNPITSGFELLDLSLIANSIKTNHQNLVNPTIGSIKILSNTMGYQCLMTRWKLARYDRYLAIFDGELHHL